VAKCPRCLETELNPEQARNSYSRYAPVYICVGCGDEETQIIFRKIGLKGPVRERHHRMLALAEQEKEKGA